MLYRMLSLTIAAYLAFSQPGVYAQGSIPSEYHVKAAFIYNFLRYVEWPAETLQTNSPAVSICVMGDDPLNPVLEAIKGNKVGGKTIAINKINSLSHINECICVLIGRSEKGKLHEILPPLRYLPVLTVGDMEGFAEAGGMIGFIMEENKVRFKINISAVKEGRLNISSQLLKVGYIVPFTQISPQRGEE